MEDSNLMATQGWRTVADPEGFHAFHGTPLSQESTADYVIR